MNLNDTFFRPTYIKQVYLQAIVKHTNNTPRSSLHYLIKPEYSLFEIDLEGKIN